MTSFEIIHENIINGNRNDAKTAIKKMSKKELLQFIKHIAEQSNIEDAINEVFKLVD